MSGLEPCRLATGGEIDRDRVVRFTFDARPMTGRAGDTLASALLANGVRVVGRSFKFHRPRGIFTAGPEEPNALVRLGCDGRIEPNTRATMVQLYEGLRAESQNRWPSLGFDAMVLMDLASGLLPAGFYYKTFMWPRRAWHFYEGLIRRAAGMGRASARPDSGRYEHRHRHCDVLIAGSGPSGLAAAHAAAAAGARVLLCDEHHRLGGRLRFERVALDGEIASDWCEKKIAELRLNPDVTLLPETTAIGIYDHDLVALVENVVQPGEAASGFEPRQRLWLVRAKRIILATGAIERPIAFANNDLPGVMLAAAARRYLNQYAVTAGRRAVVFTNNDDAYRTAVDLAESGVEVVGVVDVRAQPDFDRAALLQARGIPSFCGHAVVAASGRGQVRRVSIEALGGGGEQDIACDLLCVSGGWNPTLHLYSQARGRLRYDDRRGAFLPDGGSPAIRVAGRAAGLDRIEDCVRDGRAAVQAAGFPAPDDPPVRCTKDWHCGIAPFWSAPNTKRHGKRFVDLQNDVTVEDLLLAEREGYRGIELAKRYTTLGMGTDQGKTSGVLGAAILAEALGTTPDRVGLSTFRPPYTPVSFGVLAGRHAGKALEPVRRTPMHDWHARHGARWIEAGHWVRPRAYLRPGETFDAAWMREVQTVRNFAGIVDVSTLGRIDVRGPDAGALLDRLYCNQVGTIAPGKTRYGLMLRDDGIVLDDGTVSRLSDCRFLVSTTTAHAARVLAHMERVLQVDWPGLRVHVASTTDQWAQIAVAGPQSRAVLQRVVVGIALANEAFPHLSCGECGIADAACLVFRMSYSGELAYELAVPAGSGTAVWDRLLEAGADLGIAPYGTEAMGAMRIEKGHVAGPELDGRTTPGDLGMDRLVSRKKTFIGMSLLDRPALQAPDRPSLVGLVPLDGKSAIRAGAHLLGEPRGWVSSATFSPTLGHPIALGFAPGGVRRGAEAMTAVSPLFGEQVAVRVVSPVFYDPEGRKLRA